MHAHCAMNCYREIRDADTEQILELLNVCIRYLRRFSSALLARSSSRSTTSILQKSFETNPLLPPSNVQSKIVHMLLQLPTRIASASKYGCFARMSLYSLCLFQDMLQTVPVSIRLAPPNRTLVSRLSRIRLMIFRWVEMFRTLYQDQQLTAKLNNAGVAVPNNSTREALIAVSRTVEFDTSHRDSICLDGTKPSPPVLGTAARTATTTTIESGLIGAWTTTCVRLRIGDQKTVPSTSDPFSAVFFSICFVNHQWTEVLRLTRLFNVQL